MSKEQVSQSYLDEQLNLHGWKEVQQPRNIAIFGVRHHNIGEGIANVLLSRGHIVALYEKGEGDFDIVVPATYPNMQNYDVVINCCAVTHLDWIEDYPDGEMVDVVGTNLIGAMMLTAEFVRATLHNAEAKTIIHIGSMAYNHVLNGSAPYCASKAGLAHFCNCIAHELAPKGYSVYCLHPGNTLGTPMSEATIEGLMRYRGLDHDDAVRYWSEGKQRDDFITPLLIGEVCALLLGEHVVWASGSHIHLNGGAR